MPRALKQTIFTTQRSSVYNRKPHLYNHKSQCSNDKRDAWNKSDIRILIYTALLYRAECYYGINTFPFVGIYKKITDGVTLKRLWILKSLHVSYTFFKNIFDLHYKSITVLHGNTIAWSHDPFYRFRGQKKDRSCLEWCNHWENIYRQI